MIKKEKVDITTMSMTGFRKWFKERFWEINGKFVLPTSEELQELSDEIFNAFK